MSGKGLPGDPKEHPTEVRKHDVNKEVDQVAARGQV